MSPRTPINLPSSMRFQTGVDVLQAELASERASTLGRMGRAVETALAELRAHTGPAAEREPLLAAASAAVWYYFIQREVCGALNHRDAIAHYAIPDDVLARLGRDHRAGGGVAGLTAAAWRKA